MNSMLNREAWLNVLATQFCLPLIQQHVTLDEARPSFRVSCGFPKGRGGKGAQRIGECHHPKSSADGTVEIFISPIIADPVKVAATLLHELVHFAVGNECGHKGEFRRVAKAVGLEGQMTATLPSEPLVQTIKTVWLVALPPYPHAALKPSDAGSGPGSRLLKMDCATCGFTVRISRKWAERVEGFGCPSCHKDIVHLHE